MSLLVCNSVLLRLVSEVPVLEDTLCRVLTLGLSRDVHLSTADLIELVDIIVRRAANIHADGIADCNFIVCYSINYNWFN